MLEECSPDGACCLCFYSLRLNTAALYTKHGKLENKNNCVFTKCHVICWNVWADWWAVRGGSGGITPVTNPTWVTGIARCEGRALPSQKVGLSRAANPVSVPLLPPFSCTGIWVNVGKAVILLAMFLLGFLWLCSLKVRETWDKAFHKPCLCHRVSSAPNLTEKY